MYFTQDDYIRIERWLQTRAIKDTQFPRASALIGVEWVPIIQEGKNKITSVENFIEESAGIVIENIREDLSGLTNRVATNETNISTLDTNLTRFQTDTLTGINSINSRLNTNEYDILELNRSVDNIIDSKNQPNGIAGLNEAGLISPSNLPSYVDDVIEVDYIDNVDFPERGKIYIDLSTDIQYRWSGTRFVELTKFIELGEGVTNAYPGNKGKELAISLANTQRELSRIIDTYTTVNAPDKFLFDKIINDVSIDLDKDFVLLMKDGSLYIEKDKSWANTINFNYYSSYKNILWDGETNPKFFKIISFGNVRNPDGTIAKLSIWGCNTIKSIPAPPEEHKWTIAQDGLQFTNLDDLSNIDFSGIIYGAHMFQGGNIPRGSYIYMPDSVNGIRLCVGAHFGDAPSLFCSDEPSTINTIANTFPSYTFDLPKATSWTKAFAGCRIENIGQLKILAPETASMASMFQESRIGYLTFPEWWKNLCQKVTTVTSLFRGTIFDDEHLKVTIRTADYPACRDFSFMFANTNIEELEFIHDGNDNSLSLNNICRDCKNLKKVTITVPEGKYIGLILSQAFHGCYNLEKVVLNNLGSTLNYETIFEITDSVAYRKLRTVSISGNWSKFNLSTLVSLSKDSLRNILNNATRTTNTSSLTLPYNIYTHIYSKDSELAALAEAKNKEVICGPDNADIIKSNPTSEEVVDYKIEQALSESGRSIEGFSSIVTNVESLIPSENAVNIGNITTLTKEDTGAWESTTTPISIPYASSTTDGILTSTDKRAVDVVRTNKFVNRIIQNVNEEDKANTVSLSSTIVDGSNNHSSTHTKISSATSKLAGVMSAADKIKLDSINTNVVDTMSRCFEAASATDGSEGTFDLIVDIRDPKVTSTATTYKKVYPTLIAEIIDIGGDSEISYVVDTISSDTIEFEVPAATTTAAGLMTASDKNIISELKIGGILRTAIIEDAKLALFIDLWTSLPNCTYVAKMFYYNEEAFEYTNALAKYASLITAST